MNNYIEDFTKHIKEALEIGNNSVFSSAKNPTSNILICGLGGSGIAVSYTHLTLPTNREV